MALYKLDNLTRPQLLLLENGIRCLGKFNLLACAWHAPNTRELLTATIINCYSSPIYLAILHPTTPQHNDIASPCEVTRLRAFETQMQGRLPHYLASPLLGW